MRDQTSHSTQNTTLVDRAAETLIGESPAMHRVRDAIRRLGPTSITVLVQGPTGVGKELVAEALHAASGRTGSLVALNMCAIPDAVFESLLFGHVRGAFTNAYEDHVGHLMEAHRGTLFLDEVGDLSLPLQAKLLRVLETRRFRKVGGRMDEMSDFRLVGATNANIPNEVAAGRFRTDLAFRLGAASIWIPPLSERTSDIAQLAAHFLRKFAGHAAALSSDALRELTAFSWPGNVRQLRDTIELAVTLASSESVRAEHVIAAFEFGTYQPRDSRQQPTLVIQDATGRQELLSQLEEHSWHIPTVAQALGVTPKTVYARIRRLGLAIPGRYRRRQAPEVMDAPR